MARCKYCGAEGVDWKRCDSGSGWDLVEPDGDYHECKPEDRKKEYERCLVEKAQTCEATKKYREANGYL
jgi:hypothetical protein